MGSPILPFIGIGLTVLAVLFYIIATATNAWTTVKVPDDDITAKTGLWKTCGYECFDFGFIISADINVGELYFCRFAMIVSILVAVGALIFPLLIYFKKLQKKFAKVSAGLIIGSAVLVLCGTVSFAAFKDRVWFEHSFGYSIILAWLSIPIAIAGGILILLGGLDTPVEFMENDVALA